MLWKIYFWVFTPLSLIILGLTYQESDYLSILIILAAITALHAVAFNDFTIPKELWKIVFLVIIAGIIISFFLYKLPLKPLDIIINVPFLPVIYAVYKLAFKRKS